MPNHKSNPPRGENEKLSFEQSHPDRRNVIKLQLKEHFHPINHLHSPQLHHKLDQLLPYEINLHQVLEPSKWLEITHNYNIRLVSSPIAQAVEEETIVYSRCNTLPSRIWDGCVVLDIE